MDSYEETLMRMWIEKHTRLARQEGRKEGYEETYEQGYEESYEQGREEGRKQGQQEYLLRLLTHRFGVLPEAVTAQVMNAGREELEHWADRILDATSLEDVFASS
jgi:flagellar biosynthesis/type III secretory pathway protein FliH